jgi:molecular chaperone GrpE
MADYDDPTTPPPFDAPAPPEALRAVDALLGGEPGAVADPLVAELAAEREARLRLAADFANFRRRTTEEREREGSAADEAILLRFLDLADDLALALNAAPALILADPWTAGLRAIERKLAQILVSAGVDSFDSTGTPFDPTRHEAIARVPGQGQAEHTVVTEHRRGYLRDGRLLRAALVSVADEPD